MQHSSDFAKDNRRLVELTFDWKPDVERFSRAAAQARNSGVADPWTVAEIDCTLELIEAELATLRSRPQTDAAVRESARLLALWRARIALARRTLEAVARRSGAARPDQGRQDEPRGDGARLAR